MTRKLKLILIILFLQSLCLAQTTEKIAKPACQALEVGDTMPDYTLKNLLNYPTKTAKISDFDVKLLILDFWSTY